MDDLIAKLKILFRAEMTLHRANAQRRLNGVMLSVLSVGCILVALIFLNIGLFYHLTEAADAARAAFILAGGNLLLAGVPQLFRGSARPGPEEQMVEEIREMALADINRDIDDAVKSVSAVGTGIKQLSSGGSLFSGGSLSALTPLIAFVIEFLKKRKS